MIRSAILLGALLVFAGGCATTPSVDVNLKNELETMFDTDQSTRMEIDTIGTKYGFNSPEIMALWKKQQPIDDANIARLRQIIHEHGWPGRSLVGDKGAGAAFLVLQHADYAEQKKYLPLLRAAAAAGEARREDLALLEDRVLTSEGQKQIYGSQLKQNEQGVLEFYPIEDEVNVDLRRQAVGLQPLAEYAKHFGIEYHRQ